MEIIIYVYKCNLRNMLNYRMTLSELIKTSESEDYFDAVCGDEEDKKMFANLKKQAIPIKIIISDEESK